MPSVTPKRKSKALVLSVFVVITAFVLGIIGGMFAIVVLFTNNGAIANKLGVKNVGNLSIGTTTTQKLVLQESNAVIDASKKVSPSVVSIVSKSTYQNLFGQTVQSQGAGTGFIITNDGLILTNKHVVSDTNTQYTVVLADGRSFDATVQSLDPTQDLAVVKIDANNLPVVELGDSDQLVVGQWVVAVGNALGQYQNTVTQGVISGVNRSVQASDSTGTTSEDLTGLLQTDAAINPGNSGGPLVNLAGQVIGINTAVASNAQGIGFAIPINVAKTAIDSIKATGKIVRPYLGVRYIQITKDIAQQNNLSVDYGALVIRGNGLGQVAVVPGSPADKAGIVENDIILEINGEKVDVDHSLVNLIQQYKIGVTITLRILSKGDEKDVKVVLQQSQ
jgi:serine protease Do